MAVQQLPDLSMEREEPRAADEGSASSSIQPMLSPVSLDTPACELPDLTPGMLPYLLSSRTPSPLFDDFQVMTDSNQVDELLAAIEEHPDADVDNSDSPVPDIFKDFDLLQ